MSCPFKVGETYKTRGGWEASCIYIRKKHGAPLVVMHRMPNGDEVLGSHQPDGRWLASQEAPGDLIPPAPPTVRVPLGPEDVPPGSAISKDPADGWYNVASVHRSGLKAKSYWTWPELMRMEFQISRDGGKTWQPMWKEIPA